jgi:hypothetical protein
MIPRLPRVRQVLLDSPGGQSLPLVEIARSHSIRHATLGRIPADVWSVGRRDLDTSHNTPNRQTSMPKAGYEPAYSASDRPQTPALYNSATGSAN